MTEAYEREMRRRIMRMNAIGAGLEVTAPKRNPGVQYILPSISPSSTQPHRSVATPDTFDNDSGYE